MPLITFLISSLKVAVALNIDPTSSCLLRIDLISSVWSVSCRFKLAVVFNISVASTIGPDIFLPIMNAKIAARIAEIAMTPVISKAVVVTSSNTSLLGIVSIMTFPSYNVA